jgi:hypothetical protein
LRSIYFTHFSSGGAAKIEESTANLLHWLKHRLLKQARLLEKDDQCPKLIYFIFSDVYRVYYNHSIGQSRNKYSWKSKWRFVFQNYVMGLKCWWCQWCPYTCWWAIKEKVNCSFIFKRNE